MSDTYSAEDILNEALTAHNQALNNMLVGDRLYVCMGCGNVSDYWDGWNFVDEDGNVISEREAKADATCTSHRKGEQR